jgi:hypothetical protein
MKVHFFRDAGAVIGRPLRHLLVGLDSIATAVAAIPASVLSFITAGKKTRGWPETTKR